MSHLQETYDKLYNSINQNERLGKIEKLINTPGFDINFENIDNYKNTPIELAIILNRVDLVKLLLNYKAKISADKFFSIIKTQDKNRTEILNLFLDRNIFNINERWFILDHSGIDIRSPLIVAVEYGNIELINFLLSKGAMVTLNSINMARKKGYKNISNILENWSSIILPLCKNA